MPNTRSKKNAEQARGGGTSPTRSVDAAADASDHLELEGDRPPPVNPSTSTTTSSTNIEAGAIVAAATARANIKADPAVAKTTAMVAKISAPSKRSAKSERSKERRRTELALEAEVARLELQAARARLAQIRAESSSSIDEDVDSVSEGRNIRTESWLEAQQSHRRENSPPPLIEREPLDLNQLTLPRQNVEPAHTIATWHPERLVYVPSQQNPAAALLQPIVATEQSGMLLEHRREQLSTLPAARYGPPVPPHPNLMQLVYAHLPTSEALNVERHVSAPLPNPNSAAAHPRPTVGTEQLQPPLVTQQVQRRDHGLAPPSNSMQNYRAAVESLSVYAQCDPKQLPVYANAVAAANPIVTATAYPIVTTAPSFPNANSRGTAYQVNTEPPYVSTIPNVSLNTNYPGIISVDVLAQALARNERAKPRDAPKYLHELPTYDGSGGEWLTFKAALRDTSCYFSNTENVARIRRSLRGPAREAVKSLLLAETTPEDLMAAIERRFGQPEAIVIAELNKLKKLPKQTDSARDICIFACEVGNIVAAVSALDRDHLLHNPETVHIILDKLTSTMRFRWYDYVTKHTNDPTPMLKKFSAFLNEEADQCGAFAMPEPPIDQPKNSRGRREKIGQHFGKVYATEKVSPETAKCPQCAEDHHLPDCPKFRTADVQERWTIASKYKQCFRCLKSKHRRFSCRAKGCTVKDCPHKHHTLLHSDKAPRTETNMNAIEFTASMQSDRSFIKIMPVVLRGPKATMEVFAMLDGGSSLTMIHSSIVEKLGVTTIPDPMMLASGYSDNDESGSVRMNLRIRGKYETQEHDLLNVRSVDHFRFPTQTVNSNMLKECAHLEDLAPMLTYGRATPKLLIGQNNWPLLLSKESRTGSRDQPVATRTELGWVLHGGDGSITEPICYHVTNEPTTFDIMAKEHFKLESLGVEPRKPKSDPEERALLVLERTTHRLADGRFETGLLWRDDNVTMNVNRETAYKRLLSLEKKLSREPELGLKYQQQMTHMLTSGYIELAPRSITPGRTWYLPHFAVVNPAKPKVRIVHDAAARTNGISLNDLLLPGPDLLQSLPGVIMRFRQYPVAITADIKEMFLQIRIRNEDRDALRFLWRENIKNGSVQEYRMTSLVFGAASSPCTAIFVKNKNAMEFKMTKPEAVRAVEVNHYMDDYIQSFKTLEQAQRIARQVSDIHQQAGFELRGWVSNHPEVIEQGTPQQPVEICGQTQPQKMLGIWWDVRDDNLLYALDFSRTPSNVLDECRIPTKREALSVVMSLFDPLGLATPVTTPAKRILQETWRLGGGWDEELSKELQPAWQQWIKNLRKLNEVKINRCYDARGAVERELHTFVDASEEAYAAAVYWRLLHSDGSIVVALACAKSRVTPLKPTSVPRLELQAALLGCRLAQTVEKEHDWKATRRIFWSDSKTVLTWIRSDPRTFKTFVAHRLAEIEDLTKAHEWRWVPSKDNVADDGTRKTPPDFGTNHRWFHGPAFLQLEDNLWPKECPRQPQNELSEFEEKKNVVCATTKVTGNAAPDVTRFSSWLRLIRATARVLQFIELCRTKIPSVAAKISKERTETHNKLPSVKLTAAEQNKRQYVLLEARHLRAAEDLLTKISQRHAFAEDIRRLECNKPLKKDSRLTQLAPWMDKYGILRLKSRIEEIEGMHEAELNPAILDGDNLYTQLYIDHVHRKLHHGGTETVVNELRQRCWIVRLRPSVRSVIKRCLSCRIRKTPPTSPPTGNLPSARLAHHQKPFTFVGIDYFGRIEITVGRHREKRYVALFTCLTVRAIHLEIAASLTADSAISALRRFIARRGHPKQIWSDNGTNFKGAEAELREAYKGVQNDATNRMIEWHFIPPGAPFMGGAWERLVRSTKEALRVTLKERFPKEETLATLLAEVEITINSRPLTHVAVTPSEPEALTPNLILLGSGCNMSPPANISVDDKYTRALWRRAQILADAFWKRWIREYLPELQRRDEPRGSGRSPQVGDVVLVVDPNLPRNMWPRGRVAATYPGADGIVRVVDVITVGRLFRRPVKKIVVISTDSDIPR